MIPDAARMRRWMLLGAPAMLLCAWGMHAGGAAAGMLLWLGLGIKMLPRPCYPYPRKRKGRPERLFLSLASGFFCLGLFSFFGNRLASSVSFSRLPVLWGAVCLSVSVSGKILTLTLPRKFCLLCGLLLFAPGLFFIFYRQ